MPSKLLVSIFLFVFVPLTSLPSEAADWDVIAKQGLMHFVLVEKSKAKDKEFFEKSAKTICSSKKVCQVMFWIDKNSVPSHTPFSDAQLNNLAAQYSQNLNTGRIELLMPCRINPDPKSCFK